MKDIEYYKRVLKIKGQYDEGSLKQAFYAAVKENHPDKFHNPDNKKLATEKMKLINEAYDYLKNHINSQTQSSSQTKSEEKSYNNYENFAKNNKNTNSQNSAKSGDRGYENIEGKLKTFIKNHEIIKILYVKKDGQKSVVEMLPLELAVGLYVPDKLYLKAYIPSQNMVKTYRVDRIKAINPDETEYSQSAYTESNTYTQSNNNTPKSEFNGDYRAHGFISILLPIVGAMAICFSFFKMPYFYYIFLRVLVSLSLLSLAVFSKELMPKSFRFLCVLGIIVYNPIVPVHLTRHIWQTLNLLVLCGILGTLDKYFKGYK